jgi:hypothetical protein
VALISGLSVLTIVLLSSTEQPTSQPSGPRRTSQARTTVAQDSEAKPIAQHNEDAPNLASPVVRGGRDAPEPASPAAGSDQDMPKLAEAATAKADPPTAKKAKETTSTPAAPIAAARIGDWARYKVTTSSTTAAVTTTQTVTARDADSVTIRTLSSVPGQEAPAVVEKIALDSSADRGTAKIGKVEKLGSGNAVIAIGRKQLSCEWVKYRFTTTTTTVCSAWTSSEVPIHGLVKSETDANGSKTVMELIDFGFGAPKADTTGAGKLAAPAAGAGPGTGPDDNELAAPKRKSGSKEG